MQLLGVSPLVSQSTETVPLIDSTYFILSVKIRKVKDLSCSLVIVFLRLCPAGAVFSLSLTLVLSAVSVLDAWDGICFNKLAFASLVSPVHLFKLLQRKNPLYHLTGWSCLLLKKLNFDSGEDCSPPSMAQLWERYLKEKKRSNITEIVLNWFQVLLAHLNISN